MAEFVGCLAREAVAACATSPGSLDARVVGCVIRRMGWCREHDLEYLPRGGGRSRQIGCRIISTRNKMYGLYHFLRQFRTRQPGCAAARQVLIYVDNPSVVSAINRGRAKNHKTHAFPVQLFELQVKYGARLSSKLTPTTKNGAWMSARGRHGTPLSM